jgi:hypothetical protein
MGSTDTVAGFAVEIVASMAAQLFDIRTAGYRRCIIRYVLWRRRRRQHRRRLRRLTDVDDVYETGRRNVDLTG